MEKLVTVTCRTLNQLSIQITEKSYSNMQTTKLELVSELIKQNVLQKKCQCENTLYNAEINLENSQNKISYSISETKFKTGYANTSDTKMICNYQVN